MLYNTKSVKKKLYSLYRGPFIITRFGSSYSCSYTLRQINSEAIPRIYYGDYLKLFKLRKGYLVTGTKEQFPVYQNIRAGKGKH